jgi:hypothetical protein
MSTKVNNLIDSLSNVNVNLEQEQQMKRIREEVVKKFSEYRNTLTFMAADAPIEILNLSKPIENALRTHGCLRVYDLFNCDFTKVKGLGIKRIRDLTSCLDEFFSML